MGMTRAPAIFLAISLALGGCPFGRPPHPAAGVAYRFSVDAPAEIDGRSFDVKLSIVPLSPYKLSTPAAVRVEFQGGEGLGSRRVALRPGDLGSLTHTEDQLRAAAEFSSRAPGQHDIDVYARFTVCTESHCQLVEAHERVSVHHAP